MNGIPRQEPPQLKPCFVYAASTNHYAIQHIYKIGHTSDIPARMRKLSSATSAPEEFFCVASIRCRSVEDARKIETWIHQELQGLGLRVSEKREFFKVHGPITVFDCFADAIQKCDVIAALHGITFDEFVEAYRDVPFVDEFGIGAFGEYSDQAYRKGVIDGLRLCAYADPQAALDAGLNAAALAAKGEFYGPAIGEEETIYQFLLELSAKLQEPAKSRLREALSEMSEAAEGSYAGRNETDWRKTAVEQS